MKLFQKKDPNDPNNLKGSSSLMIFAGLALLYTVYSLISKPEARQSVSPVLFWCTNVVFTAGALFAFWRAYVMNKEYNEAVKKAAEEVVAVQANHPEDADAAHDAPQNDRDAQASTDAACESSETRDSTEAPSASPCDKAQ